MIILIKDKFGMVGESLEDFTLPSSRNQQISTVDYRATRNLVIVLLRDIK